MKILLDSQVLFWWYSEPAKLSKRAGSMIHDGSNTVLISAATAWELSIKAALGKLDALQLVMDFSTYLEEEGFEELPIAISHAIRAGLLPIHHKDPFDRLLVAQAQELSVPMVSSDQGLDSYGIIRIW
ncbi:MAG TPA: type II toxin-antitoxin system VapC family toxin [Terriglobales bacterium]|nr:type II toxin-antitoxin system VapC family toxin [Terriglobales bacterium]